MMKISEDDKSKKNSMIEAMRYYEESYSIRLLVLGEDYADVASALYYMGFLYLYHINKSKKAIRLFSCCLTIFKKCLDSTDDHISTSCVHLAMDY